MVRVLLDELDPQVLTQVQRECALEEIGVFISDSYATFGDAVRCCAPHVAVLNRIDRCLDDARRKVALVKDVCPEVRVIALSAAPSERDGTIVEQGLFFYMTSTDVSELIRVILAAVRASARRIDRSS